MLFISETMFVVYIPYSEKLNIYYVGSTGNLEDKLKRHNNGRSKFTKPGVPWKLVYVKQYETKSQACKAEYYIKSKKSKVYIERLIASV